MTDDRDLPVSASRIGTTVRGKYRIDRVLGSGGMAIVFVATHRNNKQFALKMLRPELSVREDVRSRFIREGYAANTVKHPGAVAVLDDDVAEDGSAFLVMELLEGEVIERLRARHNGTLPLHATLAIGYQLLDVLAAAHAKAIIHRDIKPENLFLTTDGTLKVLDFGIARVRDVMGTGPATTPGITLGTPTFMAPEQARAESSEIDGRTDVWGVGATLFTLLSGEPVHPGGNVAMLVMQSGTSPARSLASVAQGTPKGVVVVIDRALAFDKADRWKSAEAMRNAIREAYVDLYGEDITRAPLVRLVGESHAPATAPPEVGSASTLVSGDMPVSNPVTEVMGPSPSRGAETLVQPAAHEGSSNSLVARVVMMAAAVIVVTALWLKMRPHAPVEAPFPAETISTVAPVAPMPAAPGTGIVPIAVQPSSTTPSRVAPPPKARPRGGPAAPRGAGATACSFVTTVDAQGETHVSCPCSVCQ
jgi:serine/threonine-protein kinase